MINLFYIIILLATPIFCLSIYKKFAIILVKNKIIAKPTNRCNHIRKVPVGVGFIISLVCLSLLLTCQFSQNINFNYLYAPLVILICVSFWDDIKNINFGKRLLSHILASYLAIKYFPNDELLFHGFFSETNDKIITIFLLSWYINLYNFMDGIDGITSTQTTFICINAILIGFLISNNHIIHLSLAIMVSLAAFIPYNWHPARMFIGDSGSISFGFLTGCILIHIAKSGYTPAALIIPSYYLADSGITILKRSIYLEKIWLPHSKHFFQLSLKQGFSHSEIVKKIIFCNFLLTVLSTISVLLPQIKIICFGSGVLTVSYLLNNLKYEKKINQK